MDLQLPARRDMASGVCGQDLGLPPPALWPWGRSPGPKLQSPPLETRGKMRRGLRGPGLAPAWRRAGHAPL